MLSMYMHECIYVFKHCMHMYTCTSGYAGLFSDISNFYNTEVSFFLSPSHGYHRETVLIIYISSNPTIFLCFSILNFFNKTKQKMS